MKRILATALLLCTYSLLTTRLSVACTPQEIASGQCEQPAAARANPTTGTAPLTVNLDAEPPITEVNVTWTFDHWDFGDGTTDTTISATHTYTVPKQYTATAYFAGSMGSSEGSDDLVAEATASVVITVTPPTNPLSIVASRDIAANSAGWNNTPVTVSFVCSGGVAPVNCPASQTVTTDGANQVITGTATDSAGSSATASLTINLDRAPPTITGQATPAPNAAGWNNTPVIVSYTCSDALSGIAICPSSATVNSEGASQSISNTASDKAGNGATATVNVSIDITPPALNISSPADGTTVATGRAAITGTVSDSLSGIASVTCNGVAATVTSVGFTCGVSLVSGQNPITVVATDVAGNTVTATETLTYTPVQTPTPTAIQITPNFINLVAGDTRSLKLVDNNGNVVQGATWTTSDATTLQISPDDPPQLSALQSGQVTVTASFTPSGATPLTAQTLINVYAGPTLPTGVPTWAVGTMGDNTGGQGFFASPVKDSDPAMYVEEDTASGSGVIRALSADGQQLWATAIGSNSTSGNASVAAAAQVAAVTPVPSATESVDLQIQHWQQVKASDPGKAAFADFYLRDLEQLKASLGDPETTIGNFNRKTSATLSTSSVASSVVTASTAASSGIFRILQTLPDTQGGTLSLANSSTGMSLVRTDASGLQTGRYDSPNTIAIGAVHPDGTVFLFENKKTNPYVSVIGVDSITGIQKFVVPLEISVITIENPNCTGESFGPPYSESGAVPGPMAIAADGRAYFTYTNGIKDTSLDPATCNITSTTDMSLRLLSIDSSGGANRQLLHTYHGDNSITFIPGTGYHQVENFNVIPTPVNTIADGNDGALAAWNYLLPQGGGFDCQDLPNGGQTCSRPMGQPDVYQAEISHVSPTAGISEYVTPLGKWMSSSTIPVQFGQNMLPQNMVLGSNGTVYATNGDKLAAFDVNSGSALWTMNKQGSDSFSVYAATVDQNNHPTVMGIESAISSQQMQLFDGSTTTPSPLGLLNPDFDPVTQSWFGYSPALGAQAVVAQKSTPQPSPDFSQWQSASGHKKGRRPTPPVQITIDTNPTSSKAKPKSVGVGKNQTLTFTVALNPSPSPVPVELTLVIDKGTTGAATFTANNSQSLQITQTMDVVVQGGTESSTADNIHFQAHLVKSSGLPQDMLAQKDFSVVAVTLSLRNHDAINSDNAGLAGFSRTFGGRTDLGVFKNPRNDFEWGTAVQITGQVTPSDFAGMVTLKREVINFDVYVDKTPKESGSVTCPPCDISDPNLRDDDPQSGGSHGTVYDLDAPSVLIIPGDPPGTIKRARQNFREWAVLNLGASNEMRVSDNLLWFTRVSIYYSPDTGDTVLNTDVVGDNTANVGGTSLTWNLQ